jgi:hypothetical protein
MAGLWMQHQKQPEALKKDTREVERFSAKTSADLFDGVGNIIGKRLYTPAMIDKRKLNELDFQNAMGDVWILYMTKLTSLGEVDHDWQLALKWERGELPTELKALQPAYTKFREVLHQ